jgi:hypothetical protein
MTEGSKTAAATTRQAERVEWKKPEVQRMEAAMAEIGSAALVDALNTAS